jgi:hypothetical protein
MSRVVSAGAGMKRHYGGVSRALPFRAEALAIVEQGWFVDTAPHDVHGVQG